MYLLSICIPVYNAEKYLKDCLEPLIKMGKEVQMILSDDGSKDGSVDICKAYAEKNSNILFIQGPNGGPSAARNRALREVAGEYTVFCDSDDWIETEAFTEFKKIIKNKKYDCIHFGVTVKNIQNEYKQNLLYNESKELTDEEYKDLLSLVCGYEDDRDLSFSAYGLVTCKFFRTEILKGLEFNPTIVGEDTLYAVEAMLRINSAFYLAENYYHYRLVDGSYSHKPFPKIVPMAAKMLKLMYEDLDIDNTNDDVFKKAYYYHAFGKFKWCIYATGVKEIPDIEDRVKKLKELCTVPVFKDMLWKLDISKFSRKGKIIMTMLKLGIYKFPAKHLRLR